MATLNGSLDGTPIRFVSFSVDPANDTVEALAAYGQRLKADPGTDAIPIIALTAHALEEDREKALQAGCDGYLAKPVEPRRVVQEVERFVGPPGVSA